MKYFQGEEKEQAEHMLEQSIRKMKDTFCPLINKKCNYNCVCYQSGKIETVGFKIVVHEAGCNHRDHRRD
jgi:hypothetical protein